MVSEKRRRELARAKWERQQSRRLAQEKRARTVRVIGGTVAAVVAIVLVGLGVHALFANSSKSPTTPSPNTLTMLTPTNPGVTITRYSPGPPTTGKAGAPPSTTAHTPTAPVTTATTGTRTP